MAKELGIKQNTYSKIESGIITLKHDRLQKIAEILQVQIDMIMNENIPLFNIDLSLSNVNNNNFLLNRMENIVTVLQHEIQLIKSVVINTNEYL